MIKLDNKFKNFAKYVRRQDISRFIVRYELFKKVLNKKGSIVECGVHEGGGLLSFAQISAILEPYNYNRKIFGFDTFKGFPSVDKIKDKSDNLSKKKEYFQENYDTYEEISQCINKFDRNRFLNHIPKVELIKGDANKTIPKFLKNNNHMLISLLYLDFDIYQPTKKALDNFVKIMSKNSIIAFDQVNNPDWPGETQALLSSLNLNNYDLLSFPFEPNISYLIL
tara:strand:+ start:525 stop:1196 length:672 start_codon:yes stop_codon:yes gene_type:complete